MYVPTMTTRMKLGNPHVCECLTAESLTEAFYKSVYIGAEVFVVVLALTTVSERKQLIEAVRSAVATNLRSGAPF